MSQDAVGTHVDSRRSQGRRFLISVDWAAFVTAVLVAAAVRLGVIARIPW
jgi:hypothetical protein